MAWIKSKPSQIENHTSQLTVAHHKELIRLRRIGHRNSCVNFISGSLHVLSATAWRNPRVTATAPRQTRMTRHGGRGLPTTPARPYTPLVNYRGSQGAIASNVGTDSGAYTTLKRLLLGSVIDRHGDPLPRGGIPAILGARKVWPGPVASTA